MNLKGDRRFVMPRPVLDATNFFIGNGYTVDMTEVMGCRYIWK